MDKFLGGNPLAVFLRLVVISLIVGMVLYLAGFKADELLKAIPNLIDAIYQLGFQWIDVVVEWLALGAVIVVPIWLIVRLLKFISPSSKSGDTKKS